MYKLHVRVYLCTRLSVCVCMEDILHKDVDVSVVEQCETYLSGVHMKWRGYDKKIKRLQD